MISIIQNQTELDIIILIKIRALNILIGVEKKKR